MNVIFLDVDGVLNRLGTIEEGRTKCLPGRKKIGLEQEFVERLKGILWATGARIVLSSTGRRFLVDRDILKAAGIEWVGETPFFGGKPRGKEIQAYLLEHPEIVCYAIIDDESGMLDSQLPNFFKTDCRFGLTPQIAHQVIYHFLEKRS